jgi:hypothetical protein
MPNPCPIGLQSHCPILLSSLLLGLCQTHARWDPRLSGHAGSTHHWDCRPSLCRPPVPGHTTGWDICYLPMLDPSPQPVPHLTGIPAPLNPPPFSPCWAPATSGMTRPRPLDSRPSGHAGIKLHVEWLEPHPAGTGTSLVWDSHIHQPARNSAPWVEPAPALKVSTIIVPPGSS